MAKFFNSKIIFLSLFFILYSAEKNPSHAQIAVSLSADKTTICSGERIKFNVTPYAIEHEYYLIDDINNVIDYNLAGNNLFEKAFENNSSTPISIIISSRIKYDLLGIKFFVDSPPLTIIVNPTPWEAEYDNTLKYNFTKLDDAVSLGLYLKNIGTSLLSNVSFIPFSTGIIQGTGQNNFLFLPAAVSTSSSIYLHYNLSNSYNCIQEYSIPNPFSVVDPLAPPPYFVVEVNPSLPICEKKGIVHFSVSMPGNTIEKVALNYPTHTDIVFYGSTPNLVRGLPLNPNQHPLNDYSIPITVWVLGNPIPIRDKFYIYPRRQVEINGIAKTSIDNITYNDTGYLCAANKDTLFLSGFPAGGNFNFTICTPEKSSCKCTNSNCFTSLPNLGISLDPTTSICKLIPEKIFQHLAGSSYNSVIDVAYSYPAYTIGACPETRHLQLRFNTPTSLSYTPIPAAGPYCNGDTMNFKLTNNLKGDKTKINFGDGFSTLEYDTTTHYKHYYNNPGNYQIRLKTIRNLAACNNDIIDTIHIGAKPIADFIIENNYEKNVAKLSSLAVLSKENTSTNKGVEDKINSWSWFYGDKKSTVNKRDSITFNTYEYYKPKPYSITHIAQSGWGCTDTIKKEIPIFPIIDLSSLPYKQNFNTNDSTGFYQSGTYTIGGNSSWSYQAPKGTILKDNSPAWVTENGKPSASYNPSEFSWIESPAFNLHQLSAPMLSIDTWCLTENQLDGACLQWAYADTSFGNENWQTLGLKEEGVNWYNSNIVVSMLSLVERNGLFNHGWTGSTGTTWLPSKFNLDILKSIVKNKAIRFRILFVSNADNAPGKYEGFAFDNFFIGERNRKVLVEEFCDYKNIETEFSNPSLKNNKQLIRIQYHSRFMNHDDEINNENSGEIEARTLLYGYSILPRATVDGIYIDNNNPFLGNSGENNLTIRQLEIAPFNISIDHATILDTKLTLNVTLSKTSSLQNSGPYVLQVAVLEDSVYANKMPFSNVFRKFLPNAAGQHITLDNWTLGEPKIYERLFTPFVPLTPRKDDNDTSLIIVAFIQDEKTNEIYQVETYIIKYGAVKKLLPKALPKRIGSFSDFSLFPNPNQGIIMIRINNNPSKELFRYKIIDTFGNIVGSGEIENDTLEISIQALYLPLGLYQFQLIGSDFIETKTFSIVW